MSTSISHASCIPDRREGRGKRRGGKVRCLPKIFGSLSPVSDSIEVAILKSPIKLKLRSFVDRACGLWAKLARRNRNFVFKRRFFKRSLFKWKKTGTTNWDKLFPMSHLGVLRTMRTMTLWQTARSLRRCEPSLFEKCAESTRNANSKPPNSQRLKALSPGFEQCLNFGERKGGRIYWNLKHSLSLPNSLIVGGDRIWMRSTAGKKTGSQEMDGV